MLWKSVKKDELVVNNCMKKSQPPKMKTKFGKIVKRIEINFYMPNEDKKIQAKERKIVVSNDYHS